jgi:hypothetical protein
MTPEERFDDLVAELLGTEGVTPPVSELASEPSNTAVSPSLRGDTASRHRACEVTAQPGGGFGRSALRYRNRIFAMLVRGRLVVKLPRARVTELVAAGEGVRFDANKGTPMKEWLSLDPASAHPWPALAREALGFAGHG